MTNRTIIERQKQSACLNRRGCASPIRTEQTMSDQNYPKLTDQGDQLLTRYKRVSALYKTVLDLASKILYEIESSGSEKLIAALMQEKIKLAENIRIETEDLNLSQASFGEAVNSATIRQAKEIISDIKIMLAEIYEREEQIMQHLKKSKYKT